MASHPTYMSPMPPLPGQHERKRAGFCALIGRPNVGKSTLLNRLVGEKVAIVTPKPQTTRTRIVGIFHHDDAQIALLDTPGLSEGQSALFGALRRTASRAAAEADVTVVVAEARAEAGELGAADNAVLACARRGGGKIILALNKVDALGDKRWLLPQSHAYAQANDICAIVPISAKFGEGIETLAKTVAQAMPPGPHLFDQDLYTTEPERALCAELVREQLLLRLQAEVPHCLHVVIDDFDDGRQRGDGALVHLHGRIIVARTSQKAIVIGEKGRAIREASTHARMAIERLLGAKVFLRLQVEVNPKWMQRGEVLRSLGLDVGPRD